METAKSTTKEYHHNYYINHYKEIIKNKKTYCDCCQTEVSSWNFYKHKNSKKHQINSMTEEEKANYEISKQKNKEIKEKEKLLMKIKLLEEKL